MKLIIQIPCYNEENALPIVLKSLPKSLGGIDKIEVLVADDGSSDRTIDVAKENNVNHILRLAPHQGLASVFYAGIQYALELGADIIVNIDADNQYDAGYIKDLIALILSQEADIVIGVRDFRHMPRFKVILEKLGSFFVSKLIGIKIKDAVSGFRAYSRNAALSLFRHTKFTYTLETIIQASKKNLIIKTVPARTNKPIRKSRLFSSLFQYFKKVSLTFLSVLFLYFPLRFFLLGGGVLILAGLLLGVKFIYLYFTTGKIGHFPSIILMAIFIILGFLVLISGILAYLIANNRCLLEENMKKMREIELLLKQRFSNQIR